MRREVVAALGKSLLTGVGITKYSEATIPTLPTVCIIQMKNNAFNPHCHTHTLICTYPHTGALPPITLLVGFMVKRNRESKLSYIKHSLLLLIIS